MRFTTSMRNPAVGQRPNQTASSGLDRSDMKNRKPHPIVFPSTEDHIL
jgi:hypothetical protein